MSAVIDISDFMKYLKERDLVIAPRDLVEKSRRKHEIEMKRRRYLRKTALTFKEISEAEIWGEIKPKSVKSFAFKYAKENEIFMVGKGERKIYKMITEAVKRIATQRGN